MTLDDDLLTRARAAVARRIDAEGAVDHARADEVTAIRHLHLAGGSVREIAKALGISHQRVHQLVNASDDTRGWKRSGRAPDRLVCSFCGLDQTEVAKLIAGPSVYICDRCIGVARDGFEPAERCSFCTKAATEAFPVVGRGDVAICPECLDLCDEIIADEGPEES